MRRLLAVVAAAFALALVCSTQAPARPYRDGIPWSFILCKMSDSPAPPHDVSYYQSMLMSQGTNGLDDYVRSISNGVADLSGSSMHGWYTEPHTIAYEQGLTDRNARVQDCLAAAKAGGFVPPSGQRYYVITSPQLDLAGWENDHAIGGDGDDLPEKAHEFGHGIGLQHSWSNDIAWKDATWSGPGEYGNLWDLMSAANIYVDPTRAFGGDAPDLDAHHLDEMGWIGRSRTLTLGVDGILSRTVTIAALTHPEVSGYLLVRIPFDSADRFHYYTVEYRTPDGVDSGIPGSTVLINEVKNNQSYYQTTLIRQLGTYLGTNNGPPVQSINGNGGNDLGDRHVGKSSHDFDQHPICVAVRARLRLARSFVHRQSLRIVRHTEPNRGRQRGSRLAPPAELANLRSRLRVAWSVSRRRRLRLVGDEVASGERRRERVQQRQPDARHVRAEHVSERLRLARSGRSRLRLRFVRDRGSSAKRQRRGRQPPSGGFRHLLVAVRLAPSVAGGSRLRDAGHQVAGRERQRTSDVTPREALRVDGTRRKDDSMIPLVGVAAFIIAATANPVDGPAPMSETAARAQLKKLGYPSATTLKRNGNYWEATVTKNGAPQLIRLNALSGEKTEVRPQTERPVERPIVQPVVKPTG